MENLRCVALREVRVVRVCAARLRLQRRKETVFSQPFSKILAFKNESQSKAIICSGANEISGTNNRSKLLKSVAVGGNGV